MNNREKISSTGARIAILLSTIVATLLLISVSGVSGSSAEDASSSFVSPLQELLAEEAAQTEKSVAESNAAQTYRTAPPNLPTFSVERWPGVLGEGYIFVAAFDSPFGAQGLAYLMILDNNGEPIFYSNPHGSRSLFDFKKQKNGLLTYYIPGNSYNQFYVMNNNYIVVDEYAAVGYTTDNHDLQFLDNGNALLLIHDARIVDMSEITPGGGTEVTVIGCIIQEIDSDGNLVFEWSGWDHFEITDTMIPLDSDPLRHTHCNSIEEDRDGNLLVSNRNLEEITKIDRQTGDIIWRLGGRNNQFTFINDIGFAFQHDARRIANGNLTLFDNGFGRDPEFSRGIEYKIDVPNKTVEKMAEFRTTPDTWGPFMANVQTLPNNNVLVGWGLSNDAMLSEFDRAGNQLFRMSPSNVKYSYRAFRFPWQGYPTWPARVVAQLEGNVAKLYFSWNGSTETVSYKIFAGRDRDNLQQLAEVVKDGFETTYAYDLAQDGFWFFQVIPVDGSGVEGIPSNIAHVVLGGYSHYAPVTAAISNEVSIDGTGEIFAASQQTPDAMFSELSLTIKD